MDSLEDRIARLERQMAYLHRHLGIDPAFVESLPDGPALPPRFFQELRDGKLIKAIKIYREATGASLLVAKNAVDTMARQYNAR